MEWCRCGLIKDLIDPKGNRTHWDYDLQARTTAKRYADGTTETFGYQPMPGRLL